MTEKKYITQNREPFFDIALHYLTAKSKVLDIGSGSGAFSKFCNRNDFYLFDGNEETVLRLKKDYPNSYHGVLPELPFKSNQFDLIHCSHVVEHLQPQLLYDSLKEMDRVLKPKGHLVISAPLLWSGFYNDLSHVKPYAPLVFEKYLCGLYLDSLTRSPVSVNYSKLRLQYRYRDATKDWQVYNRSDNFLIRIIQSAFYRTQRLGMGKIEKTGFTLVLQKNA